MTALTLAMAMATGLQAADLPKVGSDAAQPEYSTAYDRRFEVRATLVVDRTGGSPEALTAPAQLRLDLALQAAEGAKPVDLALTCRIVLVMADGRKSAPVRDGPCFEGPLPVGGGWTSVGEPVRFRPGLGDPVGTAGVLVEVKADRGPLRRMMVTYGWTPEG